MEKVSILKWCKIIITLTLSILILSTPSFLQPFITRTPIYLGYFLAYLFNLFILLVSLIIKDILVNGLPNLCDKIIRGILILIVIIIPIFFWLPLYDTFDLGKLTILYTLSLIILGLWLIKAIASKEVKLCRTPLDIPILVYLGIHIVATLTSVSPTISLFGFYKRYEGLFPITNYLFLFYVVVNFMNTPRLITRLIKTIIMVAVIIAIYGIFQHSGYDPFKWSFSAKDRVFGTFGNPVFFSAYLIMIIPLGLAMFLLKETQPALPLNMPFPDFKKEHNVNPKKKTRKKKGGREDYSPSNEWFLTWQKIINNWKNSWMILVNRLSPWWYMLSIIILFICFVFTKGRATTIGFGVGMFVFYLIVYGLIFSLRFYGTVIFCTLLGFMLIIKYLSPTHLIALLTGGVFVGLSFFGPLIFKTKWVIKNKGQTIILAVVLIGITTYYNTKAETSVINRLIGTIIKTEATTQGSTTQGATTQESMTQVTTTQEKKEELDVKDSIQPALPVPEIKFTGGAQEERVSLWKSTFKIIVKDTKNLLIGIGLDTLQLMNIGTDKAHNDILDVTVTRGVIGLSIYFWVLLTYLVISLKAAFHQQDMNKRLLLGSFVACEIGYLIQNQFSFGLVTILLLFWMVMGMTMVILNLQIQPVKRSIPTPRIKSLFVRGSLYVLILGMLPVLIYLVFRPFIADSQYRKGFDFVEKHKYAEGVPGLEKAVKTFPYENCYWKVLNSIYVERANNDPVERKMWVKKAIEGSNWLLALIPEDTGSYFNMGMAYSLDGDTTKAISSYKKALELSPDHTDALNNLATVYANMQKYKDSEELFKKVLKINPNHTSAKNNLIQLYKIQRKDNEVAKLDADYLKQRHIQLTKEYYEKGDIDKAISEIKKVLAIDPTDVQSLRNLGSFYMLKKRYKEAKIEFNKILEYDSNDSYAKQMLKNL
ncbi:MAG: tetratricopeptide repeat protein [bacterium]|nr:tetratricopeptide repeat protein [bacterium]